MALTERQIFRMAIYLSGALLVAGIIWWFGPAARGQVSGFLRTADQQAQALMKDNDYAAAAQRFRDPVWRAAAWYRAGEFTRAAGIWTGLPGADAAFNAGNSFVMAGQYARAIESYAVALQVRPGWQAAITNQNIAKQRATQMKHEGEEMTGGMLAADKGIRFDETGRNNTMPDQTEAGSTIDDAALQDIWLRRVQTSPGEFLRSKFSYQLAHPAPVQTGLSGRTGNDE